MSKRILVAEDEIVSQKLTALILTHLGFDVDVVDNGLKAVAAVRQKKYDMVFIDLYMPQLDGLEAVQIIRQDKSIYQPYIIAITGQLIEEADDSWYFDMGLDDYLLKPIQEQDLVRVLSQAALLSEGVSVVADGAATPPNNNPTFESATALDQIALDNLRAILGAEYALKLPWLISRFYKNINTLTTNAEHFLDEGNLEELKRVAHTLKGACAMFGASNMAELALKLEYLPADVAQTEGYQLLQQFKVAYVNVKRELNVIRQQIFEQE